MTSIRFCTFLASPSDRGSISPLYIYEVTLPEGEDADRWLNRVNTGWQGALEQVKKKIPKNWTFFLDTFTTLEEYIEADGDLDELIYDNTPLSLEARPLPVSEADAVHQISADTFTALSEEWVDGQDWTVDWDLVWNKIDAPQAQPEKIPVGTRVFHPEPYGMSAKFIFDGVNGDYRQGGHVAGDEHQFVPVEFVKSRSYQVEVFPLPKSLVRRRGFNWWAQSVDYKKLEGFGRSKQEAALDLTAQIALIEFWK